MNVSTSLNVFMGVQCNIEDAIRRCCKAGYTALDFNYWNYQELAQRMSWTEEKEWAQQIRDAADKYQIQFTQMHGPIHGYSFSDMRNGLNEETYLKLIEKSLRSAAILGVPWVVFHPTPSEPKQESPEKSLSYNVKFFKQLFPVIEETGVGIALENQIDHLPGHPDLPHRLYCSVPGELIELIDALDHPLVGACWDTGHAHNQGLSQNFIQDFGKRLKATHIQDNDGIDDQHLLPFEGSIDWKIVVESLLAIGYEGDFTYETHNAFLSLPDGLLDAKLKYSVTLANHLVDQK